METIRLFQGIIFILLLTGAAPLQASEKIRIVTTTSTFGDIAKLVAGSEAEIYFIASPKRDVHFISPTPKDVLKVKKAQVFIHAGLDLEAWREPLLNAAGNPDFLGGAKAAIDISKGMELLEIPASISRAEGDIHIFGNPHYWMDPENAKIIADNIAGGLAIFYPENAELFRNNARGFKNQIDAKLIEWEKQLEPFRGSPVLTYHRNWPYFAKRFGLEVLGYLEPKPGIPPTAKHLAELERLIQEKSVKVIIRESYQEERTANKLADDTGALVVTLTQSVGGVKEAPDYFSLIDFNVSKLAEAFRAGKAD